MPNQISLVDIADYHRDAEASLRLYFSQTNPDYAARFATYLPSEVNEELAERISETDIRSALVVMARIEAAFRIDYKERCMRKMSDDISIEFRKLFKNSGEKARLDEDIWNMWCEKSDPSVRVIISQLRSAFRFRHWIAHGRHWNVGNRYDFQDIYLLADTVFSGFPLCG
ncbi:MAG: hypothetical protein P4M00_15560 [Azospirillaceae bacterium]|nr:hypothetical protein [Azospirillaceae bacterium]